MYRIALTTFFAACVFASAADKEAKNDEAELKKLAGTWKLEKEIRDGKEVKPEDIQLTFSGANVKLKDGGRENDATVKVDGSKSPAQIDIGLDDGKMTILGIYKIDGDTLTIAFARDGGDRPAKFESPENSKTTLGTLKRVKK